MAEHLMNAAISIEAARAALNQEGQYKAADALRGLELLDSAGARMALGLLSGIPVYGPIARAAKAEVLNALSTAAEAPTAEA